MGEDVIVALIVDVGWVPLIVVVFAAAAFVTMTSIVIVSVIDWLRNRR